METIECTISNPTDRRRVIHTGTNDKGGEVVAIDPGKHVRAKLADFIYKRMRAAKNDLTVELVKGRAPQLPLDDDHGADRPRKRDMRKGTSLKEQQG